MPSTPKPKTFVATARFRRGVGGRQYEVGDVVDDPHTIAQLIRYGDRFITVKRTKSASAETTTPAESTEED